MTDRVLDALLRTEVWALLLGVAAFLGLTWYLRGAPFGQATPDEPDPEAPPPGRRDRIVVSVVLGLLMIAVAGLVAAKLGIPWSLPLFAAGIVIVHRVVSRNRRYQHASPSIRRTVAFGDAGLTACLLAGLLVVGNVLAFRYGGRPIDLTREGTFSLSSLTSNQLRTLEKPVTFTVVAADSLMPRVLQLLDLYRAERPDKIRIERIDPYTDPTALDALMERAPGLAISPRGGSVVVEYGEGATAERQVVRGMDLFDVPALDPTQARPDRLESQFKGEDVLTSALARLREGKRSVIAVTSGHGERPTQETDPRKPGIGQLVDRLRNFGMEVVELPPRGQEIDRNIEVVLIAGPNTPFTPEEAERLGRYLRAGGRAIFWFDNEHALGLDDLLRGFNIEVGRGTIVDAEWNYEGRPQILKIPIPAGTNQPVVAPLVNRFLLVPGAAPLVVTGNEPGRPAPVNTAMLVEDLIRTGTRSWAESTPTALPIRRDDEEKTGPLSVALAVRERSKAEGNPGNPKLVVIGSRYVADNFFLATDPTNLDFFMNAVQWLRGREDSQGIAPKKHIGMTLTADPNLKTKLILIPSMIAAASILALGISTYLARRS